MEEKFREGKESSMDAGMAVAIVVALLLFVALAVLIYRMGGMDEEQRRTASGKIDREEQLRERERWEAARNQEIAEHYDRARRG